VSLPHRLAGILFSLPTTVDVQAGSTQPVQQEVYLKTSCDQSSHRRFCLAIAVCKSAPSAFAKPPGLYGYFSPPFAQANPSIVNDE